MRSAITRFVGVILLRAVPAPFVRTTTTIFQVTPGMGTLVYTLLVVKRVGPLVMSTSFPWSAMLRHWFSKTAQIPWFCSDFCGIMFDMRKTMSLFVRLLVRSADGHM